MVSTNDYGNMKLVCYRNPVDAKKINNYAFEASIGFNAFRPFTL